jgi:regulator of RNase E activity RraA
MNESLAAAFRTLSTPLIADGCLRLGIPTRIAPPGIRPLAPHHRLAGRVAPAAHVGSVDVFLEAMSLAAAGDVLVIDNGGRLDEACVGDLTALETRLAGLSGMVVWGAHRDTAELLTIDLPLFSYGAWPSGPQRLDARSPHALAQARVGELTVSRDDVVFGDADGVLFVAASRVDEVLAAARTIFETERRQADAIAGGHSLRAQLRFDMYLSRRAADPTLTLRRHLQEVGGAIEV